MGWKEEEEGGMKGGWREGWIDRRRRTDRKGGGRREKGRRIKGELKEEKQGLMNRRRRQRERGSMGVGRLTRNSNVEKGRKGERERKNKREEREREREREQPPESLPGVGAMTQDQWNKKADERYSKREWMKGEVKGRERARGCRSKLAATQSRRVGTRVAKAGKPLPSFLAHTVFFSFFFFFFKLSAFFETK